MAKYEIKGYGSVGVKNTTEDKKNKYCPDIIDCIDKYLSIFIKVLPFLGLFAILPLSYYAHEENINIFNHYSSWVSVLPVITVAETGIAVLIILYCLSIVFIIDNSTPKYRGNALCNKGQTNQCFLLVIFQYSFLVVVPVLTVNFIGIEVVGLESFLKLPLISVLLYGFYFALFNVLFVNSIFLNKEKIAEQPGFNYLVSGVGVDHFFAKAFNEMLFKSFLLGTCVPFISVFLSEFFIGGIYSPRSVDVWGACGGAVVLFVNVVASGILYTNLWSDRYVKPAFGVFFLVSFVYISITPLSAKISAATLRILGMGGGVEKVYYVNNKGSKDIIPDEILNDKCCVDNFCFTNKLSIIWGVGDLVYVDVPSKKNPPIKQHIAIPRDILMPYKLDEPLPDVCKTEEELEEAPNQGKKEPK